MTTPNSARIVTVGGAHIDITEVAAIDAPKPVMIGALSTAVEWRFKVVFRGGGTITLDGMANLVLMRKLFNEANK